MDSKVFEGRVLELMFKTDSRVTPQYAAYMLDITIDEARGKLESMAAREELTLESDERGVLYYDLPNRPPATREPLSWRTSSMAPSVPHGPMAPVSVPPPMLYPQPAMPIMVPPPVMVAGEEKSIAVSIILAFFFGPLGMLYSTVAGGLLMFFVGGFLVVITFGAAILLVWPGSILWAALAANAHNQRIRFYRRQAAAYHAHQIGYAHYQHQVQMSRQNPPGY